MYLNALKQARKSRIGQVFISFGAHIELVFIHNFEISIIRIQENISKCDCFSSIPSLMCRIFQVL